MDFMIDLRRLRVLRAVAHYGTVTAAARAPHFTPSAASQQIRQLARGLGVALIPRLARLAPDLPVTRVRCTGDPHRALLTCTRGGGHARPAVAAALREPREPATTAVA
ncbi:LysR family transcriptional regulator [Streptomyces sp. NPDC013433]|uniref:LysR family transcriptional regulator n=1 Tax=Streptomyces sp. NPDC013433 TaxID=3155604 RepID=UPI003455FD27